MAEILIQRRRHRNVWPWLLGLLALALLPLPFMAADRDDRPSVRRAAARRDTTVRRDTTAARDPSGQPGAQTATAPVRPGGGATAPSGAADRATATAAGSVAPTASAAPPPAAASPEAPATAFERFIATRNPNANEREHRQYTAEALRRLADELRALGASNVGVRAIRANADSLTMSRARRNAYPDYARAAFLAAVRELDILRGRHAAPVDTGRLRAAAWAIKPNDGLHTQRSIVQSFFETARNALQAVSRKVGARRRGR
ncbi:MAG: hypothetical protein ABR499_11120 [Gemmatimonadaceae bacterium]